MNLSNLSKILSTQPAYRYKQINKYVFQDYISSWEEASSLPKTLRAELEAGCSLAIAAELTRSTQASSRKALISLIDGENVETVLIKQKGAESEGRRGYRYTVCVSSQVGCPLDCTFCATGQSGYRRNLSAEEIVEQVIFWQRLLKKEGRGEKIDNVVFMGMGEPFLNYQEFIKAAKFLNNPETMNIGARRLSVSTAGIVPEIKRLSGEKLQINLAISLHAADEDLRGRLMPVAKKYSLSEIMRATDNYIVKTGRRVMLEYLMLQGVNDGEDDADKLARLLTGRSLYMVNLIPYNETGRFRSSSRMEIENFRRLLDKKGVPVTIRLSFGADISAACGQLRCQSSSKTSQ